MKQFNLDRFNLAKIKLGEQPIILKDTIYKEPQIGYGMLVDDDGKTVGTKGDMYTKKIMDYILQEGCLDHNPRPRYKDFYEGASYNPDKRIVTTVDGREIQVGEREDVQIKEDGVEIWIPAHTLSVNKGIECTYDLSRGESPMITLRPIATKASCAEILWIYQQESNDLVLFDEMLGRRTWDDMKPLDENDINNWWKDWSLKEKDGSYKLNEAGHPTIGKCYGGTTGPRDMIRREVIDVIKGNIEKGIKANPDSRRLITCLWQIDDFNEEHGLKPCAFLTIWNVRHDWDGEDYLDMTMVQRSSDFATAGCINQVQYAELLMMVAQEVGMKPGTFTWKPVNVQIYDRHLDQAIEMLNRDPVRGIDATIKVREGVSFDDFTTRDIKILDSDAIQKIKKQNPQLSFPLGI